MGPRAHLHYVVHRRRGQWALSFEREECGRFRTQRDAIDAAISDCAHTCNLGHDVSVLIQEPDGHLAEVWRYGT